MLKARVLTVSLLIMASFFSASAQSSLEDWPYEKSGVKERKVIPHRYTREGNIKYHKRIHRVIDTREKQNLPMHWPKNPFYNIIYEAGIKQPGSEGYVTPYSSDSLIMGGILTPEEVKAKGTTEFITQVPADPNNPDDIYNLVDTTITVQFEPKQIKKYRIMEDWVFDYNYSDFRPIIKAIAPLYPLIVSGVDLGEVPLFWVRMEELRPILVNEEVFNPFNDAARLSFDDWFEMRMFSSYIVKESNVWDADIKELEEFRDDGFAALLKSEEIKNDLFIFEHDVWEY
ncbi:MAG: gliding motility protein GldN [Bacteroidetes bacterium]|nr:gliding motility protein GldN [Bacteroidota bacterium]